MSSLIINPRNNIVSYRQKNNAATNAFFSSRLLPFTGTKLLNKHETNDSDDADDFASLFNILDQGEDDEGRRLAREFYQELHIRQNRSPSSSSRDGNKLEDIRRGEDSINYYGESQAGRINASGKDEAKSRDRRRMNTANQPTASPYSQESSSPLLALLSFFSPAPRPAPSAGLFSGSGTTVYSSGRSIRAEIELLETTIKRNGDQQSTSNKWPGLLGGIQQQQSDTPQLSDEVFRIAVALLIVLSAAHIVITIGGITESISWDSSAATSTNVMSLMNDATKSSVVISVGHGDIFMEDEAAWLIRQSSDWVTLAAEAVRSVEELVLR